MTKSSERRVAANRENAKRSTGPKTVEGKAAAALNAMKHGLYSEVVLIETEDDATLVSFGRKLRADLAPVGELELMLADKIVATAWRLRRVANFEALMFDAEKAEQTYHAFGGYHGERMLRLGRHEAGLERALYRALHELQRVQAERKGARVPPPAVVDVTISGPSEEGETEAEALASFRQNSGLLS